MRCQRRLRWEAITPDVAIDARALVHREGYFSRHPWGKHLALIVGLGLGTYSL